MKLIFPENLESADPVIPVRWCLDRSETESLKERGANRIKILIVVAYEGTKMEDRYLVPIDQMMVYLSFRRPGKHSIFAKVFFETGHGKEQSASSLLARLNRREYVLNVLNENRTGFLGGSRLISLGVYFLSTEDDGEVVVPKEHFPSEPPKWLKKIADYGFAYSAVDECDFRRRILLLILKLPALAFWAVATTLIRVIVALRYLMFGFRGIHLEPILHPWRDDITDIFRETQPWNTWFRYDKSGKPRSGWFYLLHPVLFIALFSVTTVIKIRLGLSYGQLLGAAWGLTTRFISAAWNLGIRFFSEFWLVFLVVFLVSYLLSRALSYGRKRVAEKALKQITPEFLQIKKEEKLKEYDELYELLMCTRAPRAPSLDTLPKQKRTVRLRFLDLKAKVCRPYAEN